jgi:hypothetical protein
MKYLGHLLTLIGAGLVVYGATTEWFAFLTPGGAPVTVEGDALVALGTDLLPGMIAAGVAALAVLLTFGSVLFKRRALVISESLTSLVIFGMLAWAFFGISMLVGEGFNPEWRVRPQQGFWLAMLGSGLLGFGALQVFARGPAISPKDRPLRVAMLWNGTVISERIFDEPHDVVLGDNHKATFTVPEAAGITKKFTLFHGSRSGKYQLGLNREMTGQLQLNGERMSVAEAIDGKTSGKAGRNTVELTGEDWGILHVGPLAIFFQFVHAERRVAAPFWRALDSNLLASSSFSGVVHISLILAMLFLWEENELIKRRPVIFKTWDVEAMFDMEEEEEEEEEEDEGEEEDTTAKRAEGDEGKFGDPDIDPMIESKVPERDGKMVSKIDPKNVGLVDMLSTNKLGGMGAIANILSNNTTGLSNKMAVAMAGAGSEFVMGHGSGGMGFKGTGTGGGGIGGYGRIHGLGKIDTGGGTGMHGSLGRKRARKVGKIRIGKGKSTGFCKKGDIARVVRRRANSIRACYEQRLQVKPGLKGKLTARWTIGLSGRVQSASASGNTVGDGAVTSCVLRVIRRMSFAKPEGGVCIVQWPFVFNPGG